ncbi:MAG: hypothetical protein ABIO39_04420 [Caulobacteraceae bacterium]
MAIQDLIPVMEDKDLVTLRGNARRLETTGSAKQQAAATELLPLIEAEMATRKARLPPKAAPKRLSAKAKKAAADAEAAEAAEAEAEEAEEPAETEEA